MKIGLVRHFPVECTPQWFLSGRQFQAWMAQYDNAPIRRLNVGNLDKDWSVCYSSDLPRALETARCIWPGRIRQTARLREVPIAPIMQAEFPLPYSAWLLLGRTAWLVSHASQPEDIRAAKNRARLLIRQIAADAPESALLVTHGFFMLLLQNELRKQGFRGAGFARAEPGRLYIFQNPPCPEQ